MGLFWIGGKDAPRTGGMKVSQRAYQHIVNALDKNPAAGAGGIPTSVATGKLRKYDFPDEVTPAAAHVMKLAAGSPRGSMLRWSAGE